MLARHSKDIALQITELYGAAVGGEGDRCIRGTIRRFYEIAIEVQCAGRAIAPRR